MTKGESKAEPIAWKALLAEDADYLRAMVEAVVQATLEAEMTEVLGAEKGERTPGRLGYRSGYYTRSLVTRVLWGCVPDLQLTARLEQDPR